MDAINDITSWQDNLKAMYEDDRFDVAVRDNNR